MIVFIINSDIFSSGIGKNDIDIVKALSGRYESGAKYNILIDGIGTGVKAMDDQEIEIFINSFTKIEPHKNLPSKFDNSQTKWFPPIGNQGSKGSCVAWSTVYYAKTFQEAKEHNWDLSECGYGGENSGEPDKEFQSMIMSPDFVYHLGNDGTDNGISTIKVGDILQRIGTSSWATMPCRVDNCSDWPEEVAFREAPLYRSKSSIQSVLLDSDESINALKSLLVDGILPTILIDAKEFENFSETYLWHLENYSQSSKNHATTIVGFDDDFGPFDENGEEVFGAFKIVNSGGKNWGDNGFFYISYQCMKDQIKYVQFIEDLIDYQPTMISVFRLSHQYRSDCSISFASSLDGMTTEKKQFFVGNNSILALNFPSQNIAFDISELANEFHNSEQSIIMQVEDFIKPAVGKINYFSIEEYDDYSNQPTYLYINNKTPVQAKNNDSLQLFIGTADTDYVNIQMNDWNIDFGEVIIGTYDTSYYNIQNLGISTGLSFSLSENDNFFLLYNSVQLKTSEQLLLPIISNSNNCGEFSDILIIKFVDVNRPAFYIPIKSNVIDPSITGLDMDELNVIIDYNFSLSQSYPNPFNPTTTISYTLAKESDVKLTIYNMLGNKVETIVNEQKTAGYHKINWDASALPSGVYFYKLTTDNFVDMKKCILVK